MCRSSSSRFAVVIGLMLVLLVAACVTPGGGPTADEAARIAVVEAFVAARERGDLEAARAWLADDPRVWYEAREGEGSTWKLEGGRWAGWDEHFRGTSERETPWRVDGETVWADMVEHNDYFRLTEAGPGRWRASYFLDGDGLIEGFMVSAVPGAVADRGRRDEFAAWAREHEPAEAEFLMPGGAIDPTGDRPPRMRALLGRWRAAVGLPPLEPR